MNKHTSVEVTELSNCDFCKQTGTTQPAAVDGKTVYGPWANMCEPHFEAHGIGLGLGRGQKLIKR